MFRPSVVYEYWIQRVRYECDHVDLLWGDASADSSEGAEKIVSYVPGQIVEAFVNPRNPKDAILQAEPRVPWVELFVGMSISTIGLLFGMGISTAAAPPARRFRPFPAAEREIRPRHQGGLGLPLLAGLGWNLVAATGLVGVLIADRTPAAVGLVMGLYTLVGVGFAVWLARRLMLRRRFRDWRLSIGEMPIPRGRDVPWSLSKPTGRLLPPLVHLVFRRARRYFEGDGTRWDYQEPIVRSLAVRPSESAWDGTLHIGLREPMAFAGSSDWGQWVLRITDYGEEVYYPLAVVAPGQEVLPG